MRQRGWEWLRGVGGRGVYVTKDPMAAWFAIKGLGVKAKSNGTHREAGVPMYDFLQVRKITLDNLPRFAYTQNIKKGDGALTEKRNL